MARHRAWYHYMKQVQLTARHIQTLKSLCTSAQMTGAGLQQNQLLLGISEPAVREEPRLM